MSWGGVHMAERIEELSPKNIKRWRKKETRSFSVRTNSEVLTCRNMSGRTQKYDE